MNKTMPKSEQKPPAILRLTDREQMGQWLNVLREAIDDTLAAGDDATRPLRDRVLSRAEAQRKIREAENSLKGLLTLAEGAIAAA